MSIKDLKNEIENEEKDNIEKEKEEIKKIIINAIKNKTKKFKFISKYDVYDLAPIPYLNKDNKLKYKTYLDLTLLHKYNDKHYFLASLDYLLSYDENYYLLQEWIKGDKRNIHIIEIKELTEDEAKEIMKEELEN